MTTRHTWEIQGNWDVQPPIPLATPRASVGLLIRSLAAVAVRRLRSRLTQRSLRSSQIKLDTLMCRYEHQLRWGAESLANRTLDAADTIALRILDLRAKLVELGRERN